MLIKPSLTVLAAAAGLCCANAQTPNTPPLQQTVVVTGTWEPIALEESDRSVNQYTLQNAPLLFGSLADAFALDSSVTVQSRGANGIQADFSLRGGSFGQTLLLLNGIRMNDVQSAHYNSDFPIPLDAVDHIEVLRGSGSTLYGSDAVSGVINIITRPTTEPDPIEMRVRGGLGNFGTNEESGFLALNAGPFSQRFSVERDLSTGFTDDREYRNLAIASDSWLHSSLGLTRIFLGINDRPFGADQFYGSFNSWERTKTWAADLSQGLGSRTLVTLGYRRHTDLFELLRDDPGYYTNRHEDYSWDVALRRHDPITNSAQIYYGVEGLADHVDSNNLGVHSRKQGAAYGSLDIRSIKRASLNIGAREEFYGSGQRFFAPNISGGYWLSSKVKLRASVNRAFRLPNYTDLYYSDPANVGNPNLKPEQTWNYEGGLDWHPRERWRVSLTAFDRHERDDIDYVRANSSSIWQAMNFDRLNFVGWEATVSLSLPYAQLVSAEYTGLHGASAALDGFQSKYVFNYPTQEAVLAWQRSSPRGWIARIRTGVTDQYQRSTYVLVDASAAWTRSRFHPYVRVTNLTNADYQPVYGVTMPGRAALAGLELCVVCRSK
ncbi:MAG: TonB-dependent receptor [Acidobacteriota bacterium]|nr:TonB-dependent receptor [Acidobacteriota bacterium]